MVMNVICIRTWIIMSHWNVYGIAVSNLLMESVNRENRTIRFWEFPIFIDFEYKWIGTQVEEDVSAY